ncbi:MAG TPA: DUF3795 domain-containing protein [Candidatus Anoxymicrobiaceae bacterium]
MAEDAKNLPATAYCGLYCEDCCFGQGKIADLARDLRKELRAARFDKVAEVIPFMSSEDYASAYAAMGVLVKMRCKGCRGGSRSKMCKVAQCTIKKGYAGCWECAEFEECTKLEFLETLHGEAHKQNLRKIKRSGIDEWVASGPKWHAPPKKK